jgi:DNA uptake protein ComE-like DNA-binding protein
MIRSSRIRTLSALTLAVMLPVAAYAAQGTAKSSSTPAPKAAVATTATATHHHPARLASKSKSPATDINSASKEDLMKLPGITDELAQKIIDGRPYKTKTELTKKNVLTKAEYGKVRGHVIAKHEAKAAVATPETKTPDSK